jgi:hypothetical protein
MVVGLASLVEARASKSANPMTNVLPSILGLLKVAD